MANTTADKLALLEATKADLKAALAEKGQTVGDVFSTYPAAVRAIETGGDTAKFTVNSFSAWINELYFIDSSGAFITYNRNQFIGQTKVYEITVPCIIGVYGTSYGPIIFGSFEELSTTVGSASTGLFTSAVLITGESETG